MARAAPPAQPAARPDRSPLSPSPSPSPSPRSRPRSPPNPRSSRPRLPAAPLSPDSSAPMSAARPRLLQPALPIPPCSHPAPAAAAGATTAKSRTLPLPVPRGSASSHSIPITAHRKSSCSAENGHIMGWLEAMKSASPPQGFSLGDYKFGLRPQDLAAARFQAWADAHPSALDMFDDLMAAAKGKEIAVFLDYDGTLSPIVEDPDKAYISDSMRAIVKEVATLFPTAIISGRGREKVYEFVQLAELYYAGSHGMDIMGPAEGCNGHKADGTRTKDRKGNEVVLFQPGREFLPMMEEVCQILTEKSKDIEGANVENNKYCVTVHFRRVDEEKWGLLAERVQSVMKDYPSLCLTHGRKVLEVRPSIEWDKGKAVEFLLKSLGLENGEDVLAVYIGDDRTDEDAFNVLRERGNGCGILVTTVAKSTGAAYTLRDPSEVMDFLNCLVNWRRRLDTRSRS